MVDLSPTERFVIADIPGLIEGASEGAGLGTRFLGHVERTASLIHLIDGTQDDVAGAWRTIRAELEAYGEGLGEKTEILALNKIDALTPELREEKAAELEAVAGRRPMLVSGVSGEGCLNCCAPPGPRCARPGARSPPKKKQPRRRRAAGPREGPPHSIHD